ncbi:unnamed protein product [Parnassius apollo]|uniref:(apollo) hypothetical protein n=1 Tax=Parnassius apollo TaxID=110799 RepID=A0A8S3XKY3_PARAO|nr:unnamed protein product [Parnassius apollo]
MMKLVVFSCLLAISLTTPYAYAAHLGYGAPYAYSNYRGIWSLALGQPAEFLGSDGRPLDTLDVNLVRSAPIAINSGIHFLKKRDVIKPVVAAPACPDATPLITLTTPITYAAPVAPIAL